MPGNRDTGPRHKPAVGGRRFECGVCRNSNGYSRTVIQILQSVPDRPGDGAGRDIPATHCEMFGLHRRVAFNIEPDQVPPVQLPLDHVPRHPAPSHIRKQDVLFRVKIRHGPS